MKQDHNNLQQNLIISNTVGEINALSSSNIFNNLIPEPIPSSASKSPLFLLASQLCSMNQNSQIDQLIHQGKEQLIFELNAKQVLEEYQKICKDKKIQQMVEISHFIMTFVSTIKQKQQKFIVEFLKKEFFIKYLFKSLGFFCMIYSSYKFKDNSKINEVICNYTLSLLKIIEVIIEKNNIVPQKYLKFIFLLYSIIYEKDIKKPQFDEGQLYLLREEIDKNWENKDYPISYPFLIQRYFKKNKLKFESPLNKQQQQFFISFISLLNIENLQQMAWDILLKFALTLKIDKIKKQQIVNELLKDKRFSQIIALKKFASKERQTIIQIAQIALQIANYKLLKFNKLTFFLEWLLEKYQISQVEQKNSQKVLYQMIQSQIINTIAIFHKIQTLIISFTYQIPQISNNKISQVPIGILQIHKFIMINGIFQEFKSIKPTIHQYILPCVFQNIQSTLHRIKGQIQTRLRLNEEQISDQFKKWKQKIESQPSKYQTEQTMKKQLDHILLRIFTRKCFADHELSLQEQIKTSIMKALENENFIFALNEMKNHLFFIGYQQQ